MAEVTSAPAVTGASPAVAPPANPTPPVTRIERTRTIPVRSVESLRAEYDKLAAEVVSASAANDASLLAKLRPQKSAAFQAWHQADLAAKAKK